MIICALVKYELMHISAPVPYCKVLPVFLILQTRCPSALVSLSQLIISSSAAAESITPSITILVC